MGTGHGRCPRGAAGGTLSVKCAPSAVEGTAVDAEAGTSWSHGLSAGLTEEEAQPLGDCESSNNLSPCISLSGGVPHGVEPGDTHAAEADCCLDMRRNSIILCTNGCSALSTRQRAATIKGASDGGATCPSEPRLRPASLVRLWISQLWRCGRALGRGLRRRLPAACSEAQSASVPCPLCAGGSRNESLADMGARAERGMPSIIDDREMDVLGSRGGVLGRELGDGVSSAMRWHMRSDQEQTHGSRPLPLLSAMTS